MGWKRGRNDRKACSEDEVRSCLDFKAYGVYQICVSIWWSVIAEGWVILTDDMRGYFNCQRTLEGTGQCHFCEESMLKMVKLPLLFSSHLTTQNRSWSAVHDWNGEDKTYIDSAAQNLS